MKKGLLIILSGPSGVGKGTLRPYIFNHAKDLNLNYSISMTTRAPRNKEQNGVDYYFVTREEFDRQIQNNNFLEWAEFVGNKYGTPKDKVETLRNQGKHVFLEIEINGANQIIQNVKDDRLITFFLVPPSLKELEERIRNRKTETEEVIKERLAKAKKEIHACDNYDHVIVNDTIERAGEEMLKFIREKISQ